MAIALPAHDLAKQIASKTGISADYIEVHPNGHNWSASLRAVSGVWTPAKASAVKQVARHFQAIYTLKRAAG